MHYCRSPANSSSYPFRADLWNPFAMLIPLNISPASQKLNHYELIHFPLANSFTFNPNLTHQTHLTSNQMFWDTSKHSTTSCFDAAYARAEYAFALFAAGRHMRHQRHHSWWMAVHLQSASNRIHLHIYSLSRWWMLNRLHMNYTFTFNIFTRSLSLSLRALEFNIK